MVEALKTDQRWQRVQCEELRNNHLHRAVVSASGQVQYHVFSGHSAHAALRPTCLSARVVVKKTNKTSTVPAAMKKKRVQTLAMARVKSKLRVGP